MQKKKEQNRKVDMAAKYSMYNREILNLSDKCGCYFCEEVYSPREIEEWVDGAEVVGKDGEYTVKRRKREISLTEYIKGIVSRGVTEDKIDKERVINEIPQGETAICPMCGIDSVVGYASIEDVVKTEKEIKEYLYKAHESMFGGMNHNKKGGNSGRRRIKAQVVDLEAYKEGKKQKDEEAMESVLMAGDSEQDYDIIGIPSDIIEDIYDILYALVEEDYLEEFRDNNIHVIEEIVGIIGEALE